MPNYQVITRNHHGSKRWLRFTSYAHAEREALMPLSVEELPKAVMSLPVCFIRQGDVFVLAAVMNVSPGKNLLVAPNGQWVGPYVPAACRSYPFILGKTEEGKPVLCIDEDAGLVTDGPEGESFFDENGDPAKVVLDLMAFLTQLEQGRQSAALACAVLAKHELIQPWPIVIQGDTGEQRNIEGLFRIDELALNKLSGEALLEVRNAGGLSIAYCQLLSMQHLPMLGKLAEMHAKAQSALQANVAAPAGEINLDFLNKGETINLGGLI
jgi:hypothetical protein